MFLGICRLHRVQLLRVGGDWESARSEAETACDEARRPERGGGCRCPTSWASCGGFQATTAARHGRTGAPPSWARIQVAGRCSSLRPGARRPRCHRSGGRWLARARCRSGGAAARRPGRDCGRRRRHTRGAGCGGRPRDHRPDVRDARLHRRRPPGAWSGVAARRRHHAGVGRPVRRLSPLPGAGCTVRHRSCRSCCWPRRTRPPGTTRLRRSSTRRPERSPGSGASPGPGCSTPPTLDARGLTARELDVLGQVASGLTNKEAATALVISDRTVARHLANIYVKLGVNARGRRPRPGLSTASSPTGVAVCAPLTTPPRSTCTIWPKRSRTRARRVAPRPQTR